MPLFLQQGDGAIVISFPGARSWSQPFLDGLAGFAAHMEVAACILRPRHHCLSDGRMVVQW